MTTIQAGVFLGVECGVARIATQRRPWTLAGQRVLKVREALATAVNTTHPTHRQDLALKYESSAAFLANFASVFTLNYDLLLYWVNLEKLHLRDDFGFGKLTGAMHGPFSEGADCHVFNLHGGLHLFQDGWGDMMKAVDRGDGVIATISRAISVGCRFPVYVAEDTSGQKVRKINSVPYLRHCYDKLRENDAPVFASEAKDIVVGPNEADTIWDDSEFLIAVESG